MSSSIRPEVERIINCEAIPSPPTIAAKLIELVNQPDTTIDEITHVLGADPKLAARLIDYCNSPMLRGTRRVSSLQQSVTFLGLRTLRLLSLSFSVMGTRGEDSFPYQLFWQRSLATAIAAKEFAKHTGCDPDESFLLGLVFDIGLLGLGCVHADEIASKHPDVELLTLLSPKVERGMFQTDRYEVGYHLLDRWRFPQPMCEAVRDFQRCADQAPQRLIAVSQATATLMLHCDASNERIRQLRRTASEQLGVDGEDCDKHFDAIVQQWKGYEHLFKFESLAFESIEQLQKQARETMINISLGLDQTIREMSVEREELREKVTSDALTGLKNRGAFDTEATVLAQQYRRRQTSFALIVIDLDHFKEVNDNHGHSAGDEVLKQVANCLRQQCREYDPVYRMGGEEFVAVIGDCDYESTVSVSERLRKAIQTAEICVDGESHHVTASLGVCWVRGGKHERLIDAFDRADAALYEAKGQGRNRCVYAVFPSEGLEFLTSSSTLEERVDGQRSRRTDQNECTVGV
ncbi:MAG: diguanylate cyclase [Planctomycetota bacterium]